jgi:hypothetical protein
MTTAVLLILLGALSRLFPHPRNAIAIGAIVLSSAARLPRRLALAVPLAVLAPDLSIDFATGRRAITLVRAGEWRSATSWPERRNSRT